MSHIEILVRVSEIEGAMEALPDDVKEEVIKAVKEYKSELKADEERAKNAQNKADEEYDKAMAEKSKMLLCRGTWAENVPRNRRFVLCSRKRQQFFGDSWERNNPEKWGMETEYCAIDLVRGYTAPYFGYYSTRRGFDSLNKFYTEKIKPLLEEKIERNLVNRISSDFNFFDIDKECMFSVIDYTVSDDGKVEVVKESEPMTFDEHLKLLKEEFAKENDSDEKKE